MLTAFLLQTDPALINSRPVRGRAREGQDNGVVVTYSSMTFLRNAQPCPSTTVSLCSAVGLMIRRFQVCARFEGLLGRLAGNM